MEVSEILRNMQKDTGKIQTDNLQQTLTGDISLIFSKY